MSPELVALVYYLTQINREVSTAKVIAEQAGLDVQQLDTDGKSPHDVWHSIVQAAETEGRLGSLIEIAVNRRPPHGGTGEQLTQLYAEYTTARKAEQTHCYKPPPGGQDDDDMTDLRADERRDERIYQISRDITELRVLVKGLEVQIAQLAVAVNAQARPPSITNAQYAGVIITIIALSSLIFAAIYYGGNA